MCLAPYSSQHAIINKEDIFEIHNPEHFMKNLTCVDEFKIFITFMNAYLLQTQFINIGIPFTTCGFKFHPLYTCKNVSYIIINQNNIRSNNHQ